MKTTRYVKCYPLLIVQMDDKKKPIRKIPRTVSHEALRPKGRSFSVRSFHLYSAPYPALKGWACRAHANQRVSGLGSSILTANLVPRIPIFATGVSKRTDSGDSFAMIPVK